MNNNRKGFFVSFVFVQINEIQDGLRSETVAIVEELKDCWKSGAMQGISLFVMNCDCVSMWLFVLHVSFLSRACTLFFLLFENVRFSLFFSELADGGNH